MNRTWLWGLLWSAAIGIAADTGYGEPQAGPLYYRYPLTLDSGSRTEVLGPLFSHEERGAAEQWAWHPVVSYGRDPRLDRVRVEALYPLMSYHRYGVEYRLQFLQLLRSTGGERSDAESYRRFTFFPFIFTHRSSRPEQDYTAIFPFYGTLRERFFRDEIHFFLFPLYSRILDDGVTTRNYLFPIFQRRRGEDLSGWHVWPVAGFEKKETGRRTNQWGEEEVIPGHRKLFLLWPLFFDHRTRLGTDNPTRDTMFLPFFRHERSPARDSSSYLWPLFTWTHDRAQGYREVGAPWPFIVFAWGEGKTIRRVWPFFSRGRSEHLRTGFYGWPFYYYRKKIDPPLRRERHRVLFFLYSHLTEEDTETERRRRRVDLWPLFTERRDFDGSGRLQILAPLEPLFPNNRAIERNYSPIWSLWRSRYDPQRGRESQSLLWNLFRRDVTPDRTEWSFLFGLVRYRSDPDGTRWRLFHLPFGKTPDEGPAGAEGAEEPSD